MRSSYSGSVIGPKMSSCTLPRMFMPAPWITRTLVIVLSVRTEMVGILPRSAAAESLAQVLTLGLPPLVQDRDVGADGEVPDAHVEEVLCLIRGGDLGAGRHAHLDGRFEHAALHHS